MAWLLESGRLNAGRWRTFLVYLTASPKPAWELLEPSEPLDLATSFRTQFEGMTAKPVTLASLLDTRTRLLAQLPALLDDATQAF